MMNLFLLLLIKNKKLGLGGEIVLQPPHWCLLSSLMRKMPP
jgi:hypothetical protein